MTFVKKVFLNLALISVLPLIFLCRMEGYFFGKNRARIFISCAELLSLQPTIIGTYMRKAFYWATCTNVHWDTHFLLGCILAHRENNIGNFSVIDTLKVFNNWVRDYAKSNAIPLVDYAAAIQNAEGFLPMDCSVDPVHVSEKGYAIMAKTARPVIYSALGTK